MLVRTGEAQPVEVEDGVVCEDGAQSAFELPAAVEVGQSAAEGVERVDPVGHVRKAAVADEVAGRTDVHGHQPVNSGLQPQGGNGAAVALCRDQNRDRDSRLLTRDTRNPGPTWLSRFRRHLPFWRR